MLGFFPFCHGVASLPISTGSDIMFGGIFFNTDSANFRYGYFDR